ncbi:MAG: tripartite tricarboxylate transporter TctB family protein [Geminicoccaceae bacterium]|nr:tripartite tricarboxylate transporter TctB family protein [Geminicoccaceae bacterium]MCB9946049.1 tripartite tricarboxylate transporter TctB family protein [Geminicoccaceae bacterium]
MRADLYSVPVFFVLGAAMLYGGWTMDRLAVRQIHPASIPGLVPMLLGGALMLAAVVLFAQAQRPSATGEVDREAPTGGNRRLFATLLLCSAYALGLVGHVPFPVATAIFIIAFVIVFECVLSEAPVSLAKTTAIAVVFGIVLSAAVSLLFRYAFLVRLP